MKGETIPFLFYFLIKLIYIANDYALARTLSISYNSLSNCYALSSLSKGYTKSIAFWIYTQTLARLSKIARVERGMHGSIRKIL
jgi:hypothetical protein